MQQLSINREKSLIDAPATYPPFRKRLENLIRARNGNMQAVGELMIPLRDLGPGLPDKVNDGSTFDFTHLMCLIRDWGWDTGEPEVLKEAMAKIYKSSKKVIWLNPLSGNPNYKPEVTGIQTILPYVDAMAAAHNLDSLRTALRQLRISRRKPVL